MTSLVEPICYNCKHFARRAGSRRALRPMHCAAFPDGIPTPISLSQADHRKPIHGDHGIQFESDNAPGDAYAAMIFGDHRKGGEDTIVSKPVIAAEQGQTLRHGDHVFEGPKPWK